jgi:conjugal transfer pilus assembly protein TraK
MATLAKRFRNFLFSTCCGVVLSPAVFALQTFDVRDGGTITARISIKDASRVKVEGAAITDVFGDVSTRDGGRLVVTADDAKGEIYVKPTVQAGTAPIHVFVTTAKATYGLLLIPTDIPADTVLLRDRNATKDERAPARASSSYIRQLKGLVLALASDRLTPELTVTEVNRPVLLWNEVDYFHLRDASNAACTASQYQLREKQGKPMRLDEREFYTKDVAAVAIDQLDLPPFGSTHVYIIRCGGK